MSLMLKILSYRKYLWIALALLLCGIALTSTVAKNTILNKIAPSLAKKMAKTYVSNCDYEHIININCEKIAMMTPHRYERKVTRAYSDLITLGGENFANKYNIRENMPKEKVIERLKNLKRERLLELIDEFPNGVIINLIKRGSSQPSSKNGMVKLFNQVQEKTTEELEDDHYFLRK